VYILNRPPTRVVDGKTPYEVWHGEALVVHYFRTFGCLAHVKRMHLGLKKLDDQSHKTIFAGYEAGSKAYRCYNAVERCVVVSRDIVFNEVDKWRWDNDDTGRVDDTKSFIIEYITEMVHAPA
jgi:hypothetical protein